MSKAQGPKKEDMVLAAKVVIDADERKDDDRAISANVHNATFYEQKLNAATRRQLLREQRRNQREPSPVTNEVEEDSDLPSVVAIPSERDDACSETEILTQYDLSTVEQSIPFVLAQMVQESKTMPARELDQKFQQITDMLMVLQKQQYDSFERQRKAEILAATEFTSTSSGRHDSMSGSGRSQPSPGTSGRDSLFGFQDSVGSGSGSNVARAEAGMMDPPASSASDLERSIEEPPADAQKLQKHDHLSPPKPDPPAMLVMMGDLMEKLDPNGEVQSNELDASWIQERLSPPVIQRDDRARAARPLGLSTLPETAEASFARKWQQAERIAQLPFGKEDDTPQFVDDRKLPGKPSHKLRLSERSLEGKQVDPDGKLIEQIPQFGFSEEEDTANPPGAAAASATRPSGPNFYGDTTEFRPIRYEEVKASARKRPGATRVTPANPKPAIQTLENDEESTEQEVDDPTPIKARVVVEDEQDLTLKGLSDAVESLKKKQAMMEATVQQAEQVTIIDDENADEHETFLERYGDAILVALVAFLVGLFFGWKVM